MVQSTRSLDNYVNIFTARPETAVTESPVVTITTHYPLSFFCLSVLPSLELRSPADL